MNLSTALLENGCANARMERPELPDRLQLPMRAGRLMATPAWHVGGRAHTTTNSRVRDPTILKNIEIPSEYISGIIRIV